MPSYSSSPPYWIQQSGYPICITAAVIAFDMLPRFSHTFAASSALLFIITPPVLKPPRFDPIRKHTVNLKRTQSPHLRTPRERHPDTNNACPYVHEPSLGPQRPVVRVEDVRQREVLENRGYLLDDAPDALSLGPHA